MNESKVFIWFKSRRELWWPRHSNLRWEELRAFESQVQILVEAVNLGGEYYLVWALLYWKRIYKKSDCSVYLGCTPFEAKNEIETMAVSAIQHQKKQDQGRQTCRTKIRLRILPDIMPIMQCLHLAWLSTHYSHETTKLCSPSVVSFSLHIIHTKSNPHALLSNQYRNPFDEGAAAGASVPVPWPGTGGGGRNNGRYV